MKRSQLIISISILVFVFCSFAYAMDGSVSPGDTTYYIDCVNGDDANAGTSEDKAFKSLEKVSATTFAAGDKILFKAGCVWKGQVNPKGSGQAKKPIVVDMYGTGDKPVIDGAGATGDGVFYLHNQQYWEVNNLELTNDANAEGDRRGVYVTASNTGTIEHIHLKNLSIHNIKGIVGHSMKAKKTGGVVIAILEEQTPTRFNDVLIEGCTISTIDNTGICTIGKTSDYPGTP